MAKYNLLPPVVFRKAVLGGRLGYIAGWSLLLLRVASSDFACKTA